MRMSGWHLDLMDSNCVAVVTFTLNNPDADEWLTPSPDGCKLCRSCYFYFEQPWCGWVADTFTWWLLTVSQLLLLLWTILMRMSGWHLDLMDANCVAVVTFTLNNPDADEWLTPWPDGCKLCRSCYFYFEQSWCRWVFDTLTWWILTVSQLLLLLWTILMRMSGWHLDLMDANCVAVVTFTLNNPDADEWLTPWPDGCKLCRSCYFYFEQSWCGWVVDTFTWWMKTVSQVLLLLWTILMQMSGWHLDLMDYNCVAVATFTLNNPDADEWLTPSPDGCKLCRSCYVYFEQSWCGWVVDTLTWWMQTVS